MTRILVLLAACGDPRSSGADVELRPDNPAPPGVPPPDETGDTGSPPGLTGPLGITLLEAAPHDRIGSIVVVSWIQVGTADVFVEFTFENDVWSATALKTYGPGPQESLLLGVPFDEEVIWRLTATDGIDTYTSPDMTIANGPLPSDTPVAQINQSDPALYDAAGAPYFLVGLPELGVTWAGDPWWVVIVDRLGRVVWTMKSPVNRSFMHARVALDGKSLLLDHNAYWPTFTDDSEIEQTLIDGTVLHTYDTPWLHHPWTDLPDGSIAYGALLGDGEHIVIVHADGTTEDLFDCEAWLDSVGAGAGCASNTLTYHEPTNKLLFSHYTNGTIIEVDRTTGLVERWWGEALTPWVFDPPGSQFTWQHGGHITATGTLLTSTDDTFPGGLRTVAREYALDDGTKTLTQVAAFGMDDDLYGGVMGEAFYLPNGNLIHNTGGLARIREFTPDGTVVWDIEWANDAVGRSMPIVDLYALAP